IIWKFKDEVEKNIKAGLSKRKAKLEAASSLFGIEIEKSKRGDPLYDKFEKDLFDHLSEAEQNIDQSKFDLGLKNVPDYRTLDYSKSVNQLSVLAHYYKLLDQASAIRTIQSAL